MKHMWEGLGFVVAGLIVLSIAAAMIEPYLDTILLIVLLAIGALFITKGYIWIAKRRRHF